MPNKDDWKMPGALVEALRWPGRPDIPLERQGDYLVATDGEERVAFPIIDGTPVLINEENSIFRVSDFQDHAVTTMDLRPKTERSTTFGKCVKSVLNGLIPGRSRSITDFSSDAALASILDEQPDARILVIGAGDARFIGAEAGCIVYSDVARAPDTHLIADAHDIPFEDGAFDAVFAIAVLEHVVDPFRCVSEFQRVLKPGGYVYSVTPFMQQVHMGRYDFTRFTALGHRRLFRWFDELRTGVANGPGMAAAWSIEYFAKSFSERRMIRSLLSAAARFLVQPCLWLDGLTVRKRGTYDCASAYYFFGRLRGSPIEDREILAQYKGLV